MNPARDFLLLLLICISHSVFAVSWQNSPEIEQIFKNAGVAGTFVVYDVSTNKMIGHNQKRAQTRFIPASTFKIPNSLIGLETKAVSSVDEILPYGGKPQSIKTWEKDMGLREAIKISNVPIYQELARRITQPKMATALKKLNYGNAQMGKDINQFWLDGSLKISAIEQTQFLAQLANNTLPLSKGSQLAVKEITLLEQGSGWQLYGKTGWSGRTKPGTGWWVGWVKKDNKVYSFAVNIEIHDEKELNKRIALGKSSLQILGILPK